MEPVPETRSVLWLCLDARWHAASDQRRGNRGGSRQPPEVQSAPRHRNAAAPQKPARRHGHAAHNILGRPVSTPPDNWSACARHRDPNTSSRKELSLRRARMPSVTSFGGSCWWFIILFGAVLVGLLVDKHVPSADRPRDAGSPFFVPALNLFLSMLQPRKSRRRWIVMSARNRQDTWKGCALTGGDWITT